MQQIFYNGKIYTETEDEQIVQAMLVNDGIVVLTGTNEEILQMKTDETEMNDLNEKYVYPSFFGFGETIFAQIEENLKNANKFDVSKNTADKDSNYENFSHFDAYKKEFLKIQENLLKRGITTVQEMGVTKRAFAFWKRLSEGGFLKIDVIGYVDIKSSKIVMDENCKSYRKYKNKFRLGGYHLVMDGRFDELKAWLKKPYKHSKEYCGYGEYYCEQLSCLLKEIFSEKKQIVVSAHGDKAIDEFLTTFEEVAEKEKVEEFYRPIIVGCELYDKKTIDRLKKNGMSLCVELSDKQTVSLIKDYVGFKRKNKYLNLKKIVASDIKFVLSGKRELENEIFYDYGEVLEKTQKSKLISKKHQIDIKNAVKSIFNHSAYLLFDQETKGSLENSKQATFVVLENPIETYVMGQEKEYNMTLYVNGQKIKTQR